MMEDLVHNYHLLLFCHACKYNNQHLFRTDEDFLICYGGKVLSQNFLDIWVAWALKLYEKGMFYICSWVKNKEIV